MDIISIVLILLMQELKAPEVPVQTQTAISECIVSLEKTQATTTEAYIKSGFKGDW